MAEPDQISPDGRWEIVWRIEKDFNAYFESDSRWEIVVRNRATQQVFDTFYYSEYANSRGSSSSGVEHLEFSPDSASVIAHWVGGKVETIALPPPDTA